MPMIEVADLRKVYGQRTVVDGLSFSVESGEIFGILGPNGAGKTTAVECIGGLRERDGGTVTVAGMDPAKEGAALRGGGGPGGGRGPRSGRCWESSCRSPGCPTR